MKATEQLKAMDMMAVNPIARDSVHSAVTTLAGRLGCLAVLGVVTYSAGVLITCRSHVGDVMLVLAKFKK